MTDALLPTEGIERLRRAADALPSCKETPLGKHQWLWSYGEVVEGRQEINVQCDACTLGFGIRVDASLKKTRANAN